MCLTAETGWIGIRSPNHPIAQALLNQSGLPIAAPSANLFSHVSPTTADHVLTDFHDSEYEILILEGGSCSFGIESTVI
jgi:L-threonylcarbamoyladenylate synthase